MLSKSATCVDPRQAKSTTTCTKSSDHRTSQAVALLRNHLQAISSSQLHSPFRASPSGLLPEQHLTIGTSNYNRIDIAQLQFSCSFNCAQYFGGDQRHKRNRDKRSTELTTSSLPDRGAGSSIASQATMPSLFPAASTLSATFGFAAPTTHALNYQKPAAKSSPYLARSHLYPSWDVAEDAKNKAAGLSDAAQKELQKASNIAQAKAGKIELYSGKYYAVCHNSTIDLNRAIE
jgi:hypothetical protein